LPLDKPGVLVHSSFDVRAKVARLLLPGLLALLLATATGLLVHYHEGYVAVPAACCTDHQRYLAMAGDGSQPEEAGKEKPFAYRVLSPAIVRALPFSETTGFHILTVVSLTASALLFFLLLRTLGFDDFGAAGGVLLFGGLYWLVEFSQVDFAVVDPLTFMFFAAVPLALYKRLPLALTAALIAVAVANRESALMLVPVALVYLWRTGRLDWRAALPVLFFPAITFVCLRLAVPTEGGQGPVEALREVVADRYGSVKSAFVHLRTQLLPTWGPMLLVLAARPRDLIRFLRLRPELGVLALGAWAQLLIAYDIGRLLMVAYVAVVPAVLYCLREALPMRRLVLPAAAAVAVFQGFYFEPTRLGVASYITSSPVTPPEAALYEVPALVVTGVLALAITSLLGEGRGLLRAAWKAAHFLIRPLVSRPPATADAAGAEGSASQEADATAFPRSEESAGSTG
jgi:hypothetical protein